MKMVTTATLRDGKRPTHTERERERQKERERDRETEIEIRAERGKRN